MNDEILRGADIDRMGQALITLTKELWIVKDRQRILESVLVDSGLLSNTAIDKHQPNDTLDKELKKERQKLINGIVNSLAPAPSQNHDSSTE